MPTQGPEMNRRGFLAAGGGALALAGAGRFASAAEPTSDEQSNIQLVNDFCAAWPSPTSPLSHGMALGYSSSGTARSSTGTITQSIWKWLRSKLL